MADVIKGMKVVSDVMELGKAMLGDVIVHDSEHVTIPVHCSLAAAYGSLKDGSSVQKMDEKLKIMIAGTVRALQKTDDYSWENVLSIMMQNPLIRPLPNSEITRADKLIKSSSAAFQLDNKIDRGIVNEVHSWFIKLIADDDILQDTKIDIDMMAKIVAATGAIIDSFLSFFAKSVFHERSVVDVGILRYPDLDHPYFKLYRIRLKAWSDCTRIVFFEEDKTGISGVFNCIKFVPRESIMDGLRDEIKQKACREAEDLFA